MFVDEYGEKVDFIGGDGLPRSGEGVKCVSELWPILVRGRLSILFFVLFVLDDSVTRSEIFGIRCVKFCCYGSSVPGARLAEVGERSFCSHERALGCVRGCQIIDVRICINEEKICKCLGSRLCRLSCFNIIPGEFVPFKAQCVWGCE